MAGELPKQTVYIKDLNTTSVTLYPTRAHIVRDINDVLLKPGINEIEIIGLTPTIDEHSVQIDGKGAATIIDMTVELVPNPDIFEEIYPDDDDEEEDDSEEEEEPYEDSDDEPEDVRKIEIAIKELKLERAEHTEIQNSCNERLATLDRYMRSFSAEHNTHEHLEEALKKYEDQRAVVFKDHSVSTRAIEKIDKKLKRKEDEKLKAGKESRKLKEKQQKRKEKEARSRRLKNAEKRKAAQHVKNERLRYWPKKVYRVLLQLEATSMDTPSSSRRASFDSVTLAQSVSPSKDIGPTKTKILATETLVSLSLSYVTREAAWTPRYDIKLSSVTKSAIIVYRTEFINHTSETWKDAKVSFSTSQTSYQGLNDVVPQMHTWRVRLGKGGHDDDSGLLSVEERSRARGAKQAVAQIWDRQQYFGKANQYVAPDVKGAFKSAIHNANAVQNANSSLFGNVRQMAHVPQVQPAPYSQHYSQVPQQQQEQFRGGGGLFAGVAAPAASASFGSSSVAPPLRPSEPGRALEGSEPDDAPRPMNEVADLLESMDFDEPTWEDNGLTTTYDIPHPRTLPPSSQTRRHKIATLNASNISLSHVAVPKLRNAAFLRAKIRNPSSSVTLLKGWAGVTLDGSFLGNMSLPRVSPSQLFELPLGVDPAIHVSYPRPSVMRSSQGIFSKESAQVYTRNIWLTNTKPMPVELLVLDQVPVSEEEKLKIDITSPRGLVKEGDSAKAGISAKDANAASASGSAGPSKWGSAVATLKKNGHVSYAVKMEKGGACLLKLEYEARLPTSDHIESV